MTLFRVTVRAEYEVEVYAASSLDVPAIAVAAVAPDNTPTADRGPIRLLSIETEVR